MRRLARTTPCLLLFAATFALGLSACAEEQTGSAGSDTITARVEGDAAIPDARDDRNLAADSVSVESTINLLRQNAQGIATNRAIQNLNGWQRRLDDVEAPALNRLTDSLKTQLTAGRIDAQAVGKTLVQMGARTSRAADTLSGGTARELDQLARRLTQTGEQLTVGGSGE